MKRAFTLIEINLAMLIMAGGILSVVGLYAFGFRENRQGVEDVSAAAFADAVVSPLAMAISATNVTWNKFRQEFYFPGDRGWGEYFDNNGQIEGRPDGKASGAYGAVKSWLGYTETMPSYNSSENAAKMTYGIVIMHARDSATASIGFRAAPRDKPSTLLSMPLFYTEVRFQGLTD